MAPKEKSSKPSGARKDRPGNGENNSTSNSSNSRVGKKSSKQKRRSRQVIPKKDYAKHEQSFTNVVISALKLEKSAALARELSELEDITSKMTAFAIDRNTSPEDGIPAPLRRLEPSLPAENNALNRIVASSSVTAIHFPSNVSQPVPCQRPVIIHLPKKNVYFYFGRVPSASPNNISLKLKNSKSEIIAKKEHPLQCIWQFDLLQQHWKKVFSARHLDFDLAERFKSNKRNQTFVSASLKTIDSTAHYVALFLSGISPTNQLIINFDTLTIVGNRENNVDEDEEAMPVFEQQSYTQVSPEKSVLFGRVSLEKKDPNDGVYLHTLIFHNLDDKTESWWQLAISRGPQNDAEELMDFLPNPTENFTWPLDHIAWSFGDNFFITGGNSVLSKDKVRRDYPRAGEVCPLNVAIKVDLVTGHLVTFTEPLAAASPQDGVPCPRFGSATVESKDGNLVYVVGGQDSDGDLLNDIWALNKTSNMWRLLPMRLPLGLVHAGVAFDGRENQLLIFGGKMSDVKVEANGGGNRRVRIQNINAKKITALLPFMLQVKLPTSNPLLLQRFAFQTIQKETIKTVWAHFYQQIRSANGNSTSRPGRLHCILNRIQKNKDVTKVGTLFKQMLSVGNNYNGSQMQANTLLKSYYDAIIQKETEQSVDQHVDQEIDQEMDQT